MKRILTVFFMLLLVCLIALPLLAQTPARTTFTSTAGSASIELNGVANSLHHAFNVKALIFESAAGSTATVSYVAAGVTNAIGTKAVAATDRAIAVTNAPWLFKGDRILVTNTDTNTHSIIIVWEER